MKKIVIVFGTRPEAIKMCPLVNEMERRRNLETVVCVTGQHKEMLESVLEKFAVVPKYNLAIMKEKQDLFDITGLILERIKQVFIKETPDIVLVHGDTSTSFAAALASFYLRIPVAHVEAGLRTYNIYSPFPEEFNREAVSLIAAYNFAPTDMAKNNLVKEGREESTVFVTGNTVIDALKTTIVKGFWHKELEWAKGSRLVILTAHRRENIGEPMRNIFKAVKKVLERHKDIKIIYPIHKNPEVRKIAEEILEDSVRIHIIEPLDVFEFHNFLAQAYLILTDSGGIQEEAAALGKPVLVMRDTTERPEGVLAGTLKLIGTKEDVVFKEFEELLTNSEKYRDMSTATNPYGDGQASRRIADVIEFGKIKEGNGYLQEELS